MIRCLKTSSAFLHSLSAGVDQASLFCIDFHVRKSIQHFCLHFSVMPGLLRETVPNHSALPSAAAGATESLYDYLLRGRNQAEMFVLERLECFVCANVIVFLPVLTLSDSCAVSPDQMQKRNCDRLGQMPAHCRQAQGNSIVRLLSAY